MILKVDPDFSKHIVDGTDHPMVRLVRMIVETVRGSMGLDPRHSCAITVVEINSKGLGKTLAAVVESRLADFPVEVRSV